MRLLSIFTLAVVITHVARGDEVPTFERDIKPIFMKKCAGCHSSAKLKDLDISGGLALDSFDAALAGTREHKVLVSGKAEESELYKRVFAEDEADRMPLNSPPLGKPDQNLIRRWIETGLTRGTPQQAIVSKPKFIRTLDVGIPIDVKATIDEANGPVALRFPIGPLPGISALAFRSDGLELAVGSFGQVTVWDLAEGKPALVLNDLPGPVHSVLFSRDGRRLFLGMGQPARNGVIRIHGVPDGTLIHQLDGHGDVVVGLALRPDGGQLASVSFDQSVRFWNMIDGKLEGMFTGHSDFVHDVCYTHDGKAVMTVGKDRTVKRIDTKTFKELRTYSDHNEPVLAIAARPDGDGFVTAGEESVIRWWTFADEKPSKRTTGHGGPVQQLSFSADGSKLISASGDKSVRLWDGKSGIALRTLAGPTEWQYAAALSGDGKLAAAGGWDGVVRVWDADKGTILALLIQPPQISISEPEWLIITPDGQLNGSNTLLSASKWTVGGKAISAESALKQFAGPVTIIKP